jgi:hypothetical protein
MANVGANDTRAVGLGAGLAVGMGVGMVVWMSNGVDDRRIMGVVGIDNIRMTYGGRSKPPPPSDASSTIYIDDSPANCIRWEVSYIVLQNISTVLC